MSLFWSLQTHLLMLLTRWVRKRIKAVLSVLKKDWILDIWSFGTESEALKWISRHCLLNGCNFLLVIFWDWCVISYKIVFNITDCGPLLSTSAFVCWLWRRIKWSWNHDQIWPGFVRDSVLSCGYLSIFYSFTFVVYIIIPFQCVV